MVLKAIPPASRSALLVGLVVTLASGLIAGVSIQVTQPELPLLYTQFQPTTTLVKKEWLFILPALCLMLEIIDLILVAWFKSLPNLILGVYSWVLVVSQILLLFALLRILWITS